MWLALNRTHSHSKRSVCLHTIEPTTTATIKKNTAKQCQRQRMAREKGLVSVVIVFSIVFLSVPSTGDDNWFPHFLCQRSPLVPNMMRYLDDILFSEQMWRMKNGTFPSLSFSCNEKRKELNFCVNSAKNNSKCEKQLHSCRNRTKRLRVRCGWGATKKKVPFLRDR